MSRTTTLERTFSWLLAIIFAFTSVISIFMLSSTVHAQTVAQEAPVPAGNKIQYRNKGECVSKLAAVKSKTSLVKYGNQQVNGRLGDVDKTVETINKLHSDEFINGKVNRATAAIAKSSKRYGLKGQDIEKAVSTSHKSSLLEEASGTKKRLLRTQTFLTDAPNDQKVVATEICDSFFDTRVYTYLGNKAINQKAIDGLYNANEINRANASMVKKLQSSGKYKEVNVSLLPSTNATKAEIDKYQTALGTITVQKLNELSEKQGNETNSKEAFAQTQKGRNELRKKIADQSKAINAVRKKANNKSLSKAEKKQLKKSAATKKKAAAKKKKADTKARKAAEKKLDKDAKNHCKKKKGGAKKDCIAQYKVSQDALVKERRY